MARDHARINIAIWQDDDWRALPVLAQHLYFTLWTHPHLNYAGVVDWRAGRIAGMAAGWDAEMVNAAADCLESRLFLVIDRDTEECLIRSYVRFDGLMKQPRMAVSFANAYAGTASRDVRGVIVHEARKLHDAQPELGGWDKPQVQELLTKFSLDPRERSLPDDPFRDGFGDRFRDRFTPSLDETRGSAKGKVSVSPTPAPAPTPITPAPKPSGRKRPARALPDDWQPKDHHLSKAKELGVDVTRAAETFRNHAGATDRRLVDWDKGFTNWLLKEKPSNVTPLPTARRTPEQILDGWMYR